MTTREAVQRWQSVLLDIEQYQSMPTGRREREQLQRPEARAGFRLVNSTFVYGVVTGTLTTPVIDLWTVDRPTNPSMLAVLQPVYDAATTFTRQRELLPQWDEFGQVVRTARLALDSIDIGEPTVVDLISEMQLSLKTTLLVAGTGLHGSMTVIARELAARHLSFATLTPRPLRHYDLATNSMVDQPSKTTLSLAGFKAIVSVDPGAPHGIADDAPPPSVMKQFASQSIVSFYTEWEEYYRAALAQAHECSPRDFQLDYFGDLSKLRQDYVHHRGVCANSAKCKILKWFTEGQLMIPTAENYLQLITDFPDQELANKPTATTSSRVSVPGKVDPHVRKAFEQRVRDVHVNLDDALDEALNDWINKSAPTSS
ncbi:hypothetical protein [Mycolicibacterium wolinskyi]|uniref:hypothetical protein n=1 Tax=Mycolicibacterium wolinskyi TaxID=59750 RepID=UPI003917B0B1